MPLQITGCLREDCAGLTLFDTTGPYSVSNSGGYGPENGVTGPLDFDTYAMSVWSPDLDPSTDDPIAVLNLKVPPPSGPDDEGAYSWEFTLAQLGVSSIEPGVWYAEVVGVKDGDIYEMNPLMPIFTREFNEDLKQRLLTYNVVGGCKKGCSDPLELWMAVQTLKCGGFCSVEKSRRVVADINSRLPLCC